MRATLAALSIAVMLPTSSLAAQAARPIFREISIAPLGSVALGQLFAQHSLIGAPVEPGLYQLPAGFGDTKAILIRVDSTNVVQAMYFVYVDGKSFDSAVESYAADLGVPLGTEEMDSAGAHIRRAMWQDSLTYFELTRRQHPDSFAQVISLLRDR